MDINPYDLLGLSVDSNIKDLKKVYYEFSLLCHPDRGGSAEEMNIVYQSYKYIKNQLEKTEFLSSYEDLEKDFHSFCQEQENKTPCFSDIFSETNDFIRDFNKSWEKMKVNCEDNLEKQQNPFDMGYGELMESKVIRTRISSTEKEKLNLPLSNNFKREMVIYEEPFNLPNTYGEQYNLSREKIYDFSHDSGNLSMTDYKIAFGEGDNLDKILEYNKTEMSIEDLIKERSSDLLMFEKYVNDTSIQKNYTNVLYHWSTKKNNAAEKIQGLWRGFKYRIFIYRNKYYNNLNKHGILNKYVILIQKNIRRYICRKIFLEDIINKNIKKIENKIQNLKNKKRSIYNLAKK